MAVAVRRVGFTRHWRALLLLACGLSLPAAAGLGVWTSGGPSAADARAIAFDPTNHSTVYVAAQYRIFKSTDAGASWTPSTSVVAGIFTALAVDPSNPQTIWVGFNGTPALYKSTDGGMTLAPTSIPTNFAGAVWVDPVDSNRVLVASGSGFFRTTDGGTTWIASSMGITSTFLQSLAVDPSNSQNLFVGSQSGGAFHSTDGGMTWADANAGLTTPNVRSLAFDPSNPSVLYAGTYAGPVFKSTDGGASWSATSLSGVYTQALLVDAVSPNVVVTGDFFYNGFRSTDGGVTWTSIASGIPDRRVYGLAADPSNPSQMCAATEGAGFYRSVDAGQTWAVSNAGLYSPTITGVATDASNPSWLFASGNANQGFFGSIDGGATWASSNSGLSTRYITSLATHPTVSGTLYVGLESAGVAKSTDGGASWTYAGAGLGSASVYGISIDSSASSLLYAGTSTGVYMSTDAGASWQGMNAGLPSLFTTAIKVNPGVPGTLYAGGFYGAYRSTNGGTSWATSSAGMPGGAVWSFAVHPSAPSVLFAAKDAGIFRSTDGGDSWALVASGQFRSLAIDPVVPTIIYAGGLSGGVSRSTDGGLTWGPFGTGLPSAASVVSLATRNGTYGFLAAGVHALGAFTIDALDPAPTVASISPSSGPTTGGTAVTITGANFMAGATVSFGGVPASSVSVVDSTTISAVTPPNPVGAADVDVLNPTGGVGRKSSAFNYACPTVTAVASGSTAICPGGSAALAGSGGVSCSWSPTTRLDNPDSCSTHASPSSTTIYTLTVADAYGCVSTNNPAVTVTVTPLPAASISPAGPIALAPGGSVTLTASAGASWLWSTGATTQAIVVNTADTYTVTVTDAAGCSATSAGVTVGIGSVVTEFPIPGAGADPYWLAIGADGNVWFTEYLAGRIGRITPTGVVTEFDVPSCSGCRPSNIVLGPDGNMWFTEFGATGIGRITPAGVIDQFPAPDYTTGITVGPDGNLWFTEYLAGRVGVISPAGAYVTEYAMPAGSAARPTAIVLGPDGNLWFTEHQANQIGRLTPAGVFTEFPIPTPGVHPYDITVGADGALWFGEYGGNRVGRITTGGIISEISLPAGNPSNTYGVARGQNGVVWFAENTGGKIGWVTTSGRITEVTIPTPGSTPVALAADAAGSVWFTDYGTGKIGRVTLPPAAATTTTLVSNKAVALTTSPAIFTATISPSLATGQVQFFDGGVLLGTAPVFLKNGNAIAVWGGASLDVASSPHAITATYLGDGDFASSASNSVPQTVNPGTYFAIDLGTLGGTSSQGIAISDAGQVTGWTSTLVSGQHAFLYGGGSMTDLGTLGGTNSIGSAINAAGQVTGQAYPTGNSASHAFLYTGGAMADLGTLGGTNSIGSAINAAGQVTGNANTGDAASHAFLYTGGSMMDLGTLGGTYSQGIAINAAGQVTGSSGTAGNAAAHAFLYTGGAMADLGTLGGTNSYGLAINQAGQVAGYGTTSGDAAQRAFLYTGGAMTDLGTFGGASSYGYSINDAGQVTGYASTAGNTAQHAFLYTGGAMADLGTLGGTYSYGFATNSAGQVAGQSSTAGNAQYHAFLYTGGAMADLGTLGGTDSQGSAINDAGQVTGWAYTTGNVAWHAVLWTPVPISSLLASPASGPQNGTATLLATLTSGGAPVAGKTVAFAVNGTPVGTATTNGVGIATLPGAALGVLVAGSYPGAIQASFAGDPTLGASDGTGDLTVLVPRTLAVSLAGSGMGQVTSSPAGISCGGFCSAIFADGVSVNIGAAVAVGSVFAGFSGDPGCSTGTVLMDANKNCIATFNLADTTPPTVTVTLPNGGERVFTGTPYVIQWTAADNMALDEFEVSYSTDGGATFSAVPGCTGLPAAATTCTWAAPGPVTAQGRVRVLARDTSGNTASDDSDANFTIVAGTASLSVSSPNTAVSWRIGDVHNITFSHTLGVGQKVSIDVSRDAGATWTSLNPSFTTTNAASGSWPWTVTGPLTSQALVRVVWSGNSAVSDASNVNFTIIDRITVTAPNTAVSWTAGTAHAITWTHNLPAGENVIIQVSRDGGTSWELPIATVPATPSTYNWTVTGPPSTTCLIRVSRETDTTNNDVSKVSFTIAAPTIAITSPNTAVTWRIGDNRNITFSHNLGVGQTVNIELSTDGGTTFTPIGPFTTTSATTGSYPWVVPGSLTTQARVRLSWDSDPTVTSTSAVNFTIIDRITVTAPNTAVTWTAGTVHPITWTHNLGTTEQVNIDFSRDAGANWTSVATNVPNATATTGTYAWTVTGLPSTTCLIRVSWAANAPNNDVSNVSFTIAAPTIAITSPNTAVTWRIGDNRNITFSHNLGVGQTVNIELSTDGGTTFTAIGPFTTTSATTGSYPWVVPGSLTTQARVRLTWASDATVTSTSAVSFTIIDRITVTAPNTAVTWTVGTVHAITWTHNLPAGENVIIEVSRDGGTSWDPQIVTAPAASSPYNWTVSGTPSTTCLIRVSWAASPANKDVSNVSFTIAAPTIAITSPNTAVTWRIGDNRNITFSHNLGVGQTVNIYLSVDGGGTFTSVGPFTTTAAASGSIPWVVTGPLTTQARVRLTWASDATVTSTSAVNFTIIDRITVTAPNTNVLWAIGSVHNITWTHNLPAGENVIIQVSRDGGTSWDPQIVTVPAASSPYSWTVTGPASTTCLIRVSWAASPANNDVSNVNFRIN